MAARGTRLARTVFRSFSRCSPAVSSCAARSQQCMNMPQPMVRRCLSAAPARDLTPEADPFPSLLITADSVTAQGPFAETQATFMRPDKALVEELDSLLEARNMGVVAHFYMDAELQGTLSALSWPHVVIADSLAMGEAAVKMARNGAQSIACLGVDFMSESVRATLDASGFSEVPVYRLSEREIGCSLAAAAEKLEYEAWLRKAAKTPNSLHVVYINTSLITKAKAQSIVPTIACTSSNVLQTVLQAFAQVPDLTLWYGPDTYMGSNLKTMLTTISSMTDAQIAALHPKHSRATIAALLPRFLYFEQGNCIVHHMFGDSVVERVKQSYSGAYHTAHLEVPGEMFELAMAAQTAGRGVVGSTSDILNFIKRKAAELPDSSSNSSSSSAEPLQFVLGTESGMITSIVRAVQQTLRARSDGGAGTTIEIVFPVADAAVSTTGESQLQVVPGVKGGEGCSTAGGCATCPFMKMNDLDALIDLVKASEANGKVASALAGFLPQKRAFMLQGQDRTDLGVVPILSMRALMSAGKLSDAVVQDIQARNA
jgi:quinolinate synthase